ncbi:hypothetical protein FRC02_000476 [Tulasnella sp. 418]|nr:hypothetical protein FRC02_000476 [Tulasnella sp. 418]
MQLSGLTLLVALAISTSSVRAVITESDPDNAAGIKATGTSDFTETGDNVLDDMPSESDSSPTLAGAVQQWQLSQTTSFNITNPSQVKFVSEVDWLSGQTVIGIVDGTTESGPQIMVNLFTRVNASPSQVEEYLTYVTPVEQSDSGSGDKTSVYLKSINGKATNDLIASVEIRLVANQTYGLIGSQSNASPASWNNIVDQVKSFGITMDHLAISSLSGAVVLGAIKAKQVDITVQQGDITILDEIDAEEVTLRVPNG